MIGRSPQATQKLFQDNLEKCEAFKYNFTLLILSFSSF